MQRPQPDLIDDDAPEWTAADTARARPASVVLRELFPKDVADALLAPKRRGSGNRFEVTPRSIARR